MNVEVGKKSIGSYWRTQGERVSIHLMCLLQWSSRKNNPLLIALSLAFLWGGYFLLDHESQGGFVSADLQCSRDATFCSLKEHYPIAESVRQLTPINPAGKSHQPSCLRRFVRKTVSPWCESCSPKMRPLWHPMPLGHTSPEMAMQAVKRCFTT